MRVPTCTRLLSACKAARVRILVACKAMLAGQLPVRGTCFHVPGLRGILVTTADVGALRPVAGFSVEAAVAEIRFGGICPVCLPEDPDEVRRAEAVRPYRRTW